MMLHTDIGSYVLCNWYRPPASPEEHVTSLAAEFDELRQGSLGCIFMGDMNIHHVSWLIHSNGNTREGRILKEFCDEYGMRQLVHEPARGRYLLDLCISDLDTCKISYGYSIADHRSILCQLLAACVSRHPISREVWHFKNAAWQPSGAVSNLLLGNFSIKEVSTTPLIDSLLGSSIRASHSFLAESWKLNVLLIRGSMMHVLKPSRRRSPLKALTISTRLATHASWF